jgi:phosphate transport system protein
MLREELLRLGSIVEHALDQSIKCFETWDNELAEKIIKDDVEIDEARYHLEEKVISIIATQQPVASDLRLLGSVFAISTELERIGDYAASIARRQRRVSHRPMLVTPPAALPEMASHAQKMLSMSLDAFLRQDVQMAHDLGEYDEKVDEFEDKLRDELIALAIEEPQRFEAVIDLLDVVHALERVADRSTNIAERIIYLETNIMKEINP